MSWPDSGVWAPLATGIVDVRGRAYGLQVVDLGELALPSGRLCCFDPLASFPDEVPFIELPAGRYPVRLTIADTSRGLDGTMPHAAYLSVIVRRAREEWHRPLQPVYKSGRRAEALEDDRYVGVAVETGAAAMVDQGAFERLTGAEWFDDLPDAWTDAIDDPDRIREGVANVGLPEALEGENIVLCATDVEDGYYPIMGSYDRRKHLLAVHLDFEVVGTFE
ncbi:MAG: DUF4241 domain-containing protein [Candidatus Dormiibacterota bacterium]